MLGTATFYTDLSGSYPAAVPTTTSRFGLPSLPSLGADGISTQIGNLLGVKQEVKLKDIQWALRRFPELHYHIGALSTFTAFTNQYPWVGKSVSGPGGISVQVKPEFDQNETLARILSETFAAVKEANLAPGDIDNLRQMIDETTQPEELQNRAKSEMFLMKKLIQQLLEHNDVYAQLYNATYGLITYSSFVVDYSEDYSRIYIYTLDQLDKKQVEDSGEPRVKWVSKKTGKELSRRTEVIKEADKMGDSIIGRAIHYLKIIDGIEIAISVERLAKSNSFLVWLVGADGLPGELTNPWLDVYKQRVMTRLKAGVDTAGTNMTQATLSRATTASHIFVPNYKDSPTDVKRMDLNYRPLLTDLEYWWAKVFMTLGIPPYYSSIIGSKSDNNISKDVAAFHEGLMGARVRMYQTVLETLLRSWSKKFIGKVLEPRFLSSYSVTLCLPTFVSGGEESRSEYMRRVNQFASAYSTLSVSGMPIAPEFAVKLMFPNADPHEVVDWDTRKLMNPDSTSPYEQPTGPTQSAAQPSEVPQEEVDNMLDLISRGVPEREEVQRVTDQALEISNQ